jgi:hypothetical protein
LASHDTTIKFKIEKAGSIRLLTEFVVGTHKSEAGDPFDQWLHDNHAVCIDWSTFGMEKLQAESLRKD